MALTKRARDELKTPTEVIKSFHFQISTVISSITSLLKQVIVGDQLSSSALHPCTTLMAVNEQYRRIRNKPEV